MAELHDIDLDNLYINDIVRDAYAWFDEYCKNEVKKAIAEGKPKQNDFGYYMIQDPSGKTISYSLRSSFEKERDCWAEAEDLEGNPRSSRELSREVYIAECYMRNSGRFETRMIGTNPDTAMNDFADNRVIEFNNQLVDYYKDLIARAKGMEEQSSDRVM